MTDTNAEKRPPARIFLPLPDIEDKQSLPIEADVDRLLAAAMEKAGVSEAYYKEKVGQFERTEEPARFLRRKRLFLGALLRKGLLGSEEKKETWEETWKDLLQAWVTPLMRVAVYEPDPSFNRWFIEPALRTCGYQRIWEILLAYLERGTNREKAGAIRAFYWAWGLSAREDQKNFQRISDKLADLHSRADILLLKTFVECQDLDVQRSIIPLLELSPSSYPEEWHHLIPKAIHLARTHPDEYIRHRVDIQAGGSGNPSERDTPVEGASQE
jgi:hypothetical protein